MPRKKTQLELFTKFQENTSCIPAIGDPLWNESAYEIQRFKEQLLVAPKRLLFAFQACGERTDDLDEVSIRVLEHKQADVLRKTFGQNLRTLGVRFVAKFFGSVQHDVHVIHEDGYVG